MQADLSILNNGAVLAKRIKAAILGHENVSKKK